MKRWSALLSSLLFATSAALAADPVPPVKAVAPSAVKPASLPAASADPRSASGTVKTASAGSQQNRMKDCNKQATGKKGAERKSFMKSCLSTHKG